MAVVAVMAVCPWAEHIDTLPRVNVSDCCVLEVVVGGAVGAEWQPRFPHLS